MSNQPDSSRHINPRYRAYGRARLDIAQRARTRQDWDRLWKRPQFSFPFVWGRHWKQCIEYRVDDFAAEVGFMIDILGLPVNAFSPEFAMFTGLNREFYFAVTPAQPGADSTPPDAIRIQFMVDDLFSITEELKRRGVTFDIDPQAVSEGSLQWIAVFRTPHGICMELWGMVEPDEEDPALRTVVEPALDTRLPIAQFLPQDQSVGEELESDEDEFEEVEEDIAGEADREEEDFEEVIGDAPPEPVRPRNDLSALQANRPPLLFKNNEELLSRLRGQSSADSEVRLKPRPAAESPAQAVGSGSFRPAPKPQPVQPEQEGDEHLEVEEEQVPDQENRPYKRITF